MKVELIDFTGAGSLDPARQAANILLFTKSTRLEMQPSLMKEIASWQEEKVFFELEYMSRTIPSSWEFIHYSFLITDVTRAFTHQFVRTRTGSYAQQTMRVLNVDGWKYGTGPTIEEDDERAGIYEAAMNEVAEAYSALIEAGATIEDARGILPTNILTNIVANFSLRTMCELVRKRSSSRTQGEYRDVLEAMKTEIVRVHPWAIMFLDRDFDKAANELEGIIRNTIGGAKDEEGKSVVGQGLVTDMVKLIDQMRQS